MRQVIFLVFFVGYSGNKRVAVGLAMLLSGLLLGLGGGWWAMRRWQQRAVVSVTPCAPLTMVSSGTLYGSVGQQCELHHSHEGSRLVVRSARYKSHDITRFVQEQVEGCYAWNFMISEALFGGGLDRGRVVATGPSADLVIEWEEWL